MIINVGGRTDIVNYYSDWLFNRLEEGYACSRNPLFPNHVTKYLLNPEVVDGIIFCSKNYEPILSRIESVNENFNIYCHYTITAYGKDIEPNVPSIDKSIETLIALSKKIGRRKIAWRYDPVLLTSEYTIRKHLEMFEYIAARITPYISCCIFSFVEMYKRLNEAMPELILLTEQDKIQLLKGFGLIAKNYNFKLQTCGDDNKYEEYNITYSGCITTAIMEDASGCQFKKITHKGSRAGCRCMPNRDIGAYNTCLNGCRYCYANKKPELASENMKKHDKNSPLLLGQIKATDIIKNGDQKSFIIKQKM